MIREYFLSSSQNRVGPLSEKEIVKGVRSGKISLFDLILNQQSNEWVMLLQHPDFSDIEDASSDEDSEKQMIGLIDEGSFTSPVVDSKIMPREIPELEPVYWFRQEDPRTAYKFLQVLSLINNKKILEHSMIAQHPKGPFRRVVEWEEFSEASRESFKRDANINIPDLKLRRKHPRQASGKNFLVLSGGRLLRVFCTDMSQSGMSLLLRADLFKNQELLVIKFKDSMEEKNFDAKGVVISARRVRIAGHDQAFVRYGIRFTHLTSSGRDFLGKMAQQIDAPEMKAS
jgi:hypothetical protein